MFRDEQFENIQGDNHRANRLIHEKSPYLLQHAYNPVDWYPWGDDAFRQAEEKNKPIFLSIGYSSCHWCHVMERESFDNEEVASVMNRNFISIKVDKEERPDIDDFYMHACQFMTGGGGWPLSIIMSPDKIPFFAGTYIPKKSRGSMIGLLDLFDQIENAWISRKPEIEQSAEQIANILQSTSIPSTGASPGAAKLNEKALVELTNVYDERYGGFNTAPKFPSPHYLLFLLYNWKRTGNEMALSMVLHTLEMIHRGGIYDHVGYGFHRYATDARWNIPHFEKMLYDQAMLCIVFTEAYLITKNEKFGRAAKETISYVVRDMKDRNGWFFTAEDADSEGEEGKFYVWSADEIDVALNVDEASIARFVFGFSDEASRMKRMVHDGKQTLGLIHSEKELASELDMTEDQLMERLKVIRKKLFAYRENRVHPFKDDKMVTDWNALMIVALAKASRAFNNELYADYAKGAFQFIWHTMRQDDGSLRHRYRDGQVSVEAYADDYAFTIWALLELYQATFDAKYVGYALELNAYFEMHFWDTSSGGYFFTSDKADDLPIRRRILYDGVYPSGNAVATMNLLRLHGITGNTEFYEKARKMVRVFAPDVASSPSLYASALISFDMVENGYRHVVIVGKSADENTRAMIQTINGHYLPDIVIIFKPVGDGTAEILRYSKNADTAQYIDGAATANVCGNAACFPPTNSIHEMEQHLI